MCRIIYLLLEQPEFFESINTVHNFISPEDFIVRKGAIASYTNSRMIIPFNMEDGLLICDGRSNSEWNYSAPHGAGRVYSRAEAKRRIDADEVRMSMAKAGVFTSAIPVDEAKGAYKPASIIEQAIRPTAHILYRVKPLMNLKAGD